MAEETIIIKTEEVKVSELEGRDKQIYDYAYDKGCKDTIDINKHIIARTISRASFFILFVIVLFMAAKSCTTWH
jgi:hypothetical protein